MDDAPVRVWSDQRRITQVLIQLVGNGLKFTQNGEVAIEVDMINEGVIRIAIRDTGIGMNSD